MAEKFPRWRIDAEREQPEGKRLLEFLNPRTLHMQSLASVYFKLILISKQVQQQIPTLKSHEIVYLFFVYAGTVMHPAAFII